MAGSVTANYQKVIYEKTDSPFACVLNRHRATGEQLDLAWHEEMEIKYIISGSVHVNFGTKVEQARQGDIVVVNSCQYHTNQFEPGEEVVYHLLCVDLARLGIDEALLYGERNKGIRFQNIIRGDPETVRSGEQLFSAFASQREPLVLLGLFLAFFANLRQHTEEQIPKVAGGKRLRGQEEIVHLAFAYIHDHYQETIRLSDIASRCYVTESHFCRVFREFTGETPIVYINKLRINKAIALLNNADLSFAEVAAQVGFADSSYFCRNFKKYTGVSPTAYCKAREQTGSAGEWKYMFE